MTDQEAFDIMVEHLSNLKKRSIDGLHCVYNGSKCVVGILMTDEEQKKFGSFIGSVEDLLCEMTEKGHTSHLHRLNFDMIYVMQGLHDTGYYWGHEGFANWDSVKKVAKRHNLEYKGPK